MSGFKSLKYFDFMFVSFVLHSSFQEHLLWSPTCGKVKHKEGELPLTIDCNQRYLLDKPEMIRSEFANYCQTSFGPKKIVRFKNSRISFYILPKIRPYLKISGPYTQIIFGLQASIFYVKNKVFY